METIWPHAIEANQKIEVLPAQMPAQSIQQNHLSIITDSGILLIGC